MSRARVTLGVAAAIVLAACSSLEGNGEVATESRTVDDFSEVRANNGVHLTLTVDPAITPGDVVLEVTTDSNLLEYLTTEVVGTRLTVTSGRTGGVTPSGPFDVTASVATIDDVRVDNGARVVMRGTIADVTLSANNGAALDATNLQTTTAGVQANNGAHLAVCAGGSVTGEVENGAGVIVHCGGDFSGVATSSGGSVGSAP